ncbi:MAG: DUF933 domain-containing protein [Caenibius sp.]
MVVSAAIEAELVGMEADERREGPSELGLVETGLARVIRAGYELLGLQTFFTAGPKEARAWTFPKGARRPGKGEIHSDFERVSSAPKPLPLTISWRWAAKRAACDAGKLRQEGKEYLAGRRRCTSSSMCDWLCPHGPLPCTMTRRLLAFLLVFCLALPAMAAPPLP